VARLPRVPVEPVPTTGDDDVVRSLTSSFVIAEQEKPITTGQTHTFTQVPSQVASQEPSQEPSQEQSQEPSQEPSQETGQETGHTASQPESQPAIPPAGRKGTRPASKTANVTAIQQAALPGVNPAGDLSIGTTEPRSIRKITCDIDQELGDRLTAFKKSGRSIRRAVEVGLDYVLTANGYPKQQG
jgi:hypothetical protein